MESIFEKLRHIQIDLDIFKEHYYDDQNEISTYLTNIQYNQNEIMAQLDSLHRSHRRTNDHHCSLEARV